MTKYLTLFVILVMGFAAFLTILFSKDSYKVLPLDEKKGAPLNIEQYNFQNWHEFTAPNGTFKVMFPSLPQHASEKVKDGANDQTRLYEMYVAEKDNGAVFMISQVTFKSPKEGFDREKLMVNMLNDLVASNPNNELRAMKSGSYKNYPSVDYTIGNKEHIIDARSFVVDETMYILSRVTKVENFNIDEYNFFINSFELIH